LSTYPVELGNVEPVVEPSRLVSVIERCPPPGLRISSTIAGPAVKLVEKSMEGLGTNPRYISSVFVGLLLVLKKSSEMMFVVPMALLNGRLKLAADGKPLAVRALVPPVPLLGFSA